MTNVFKKFKDGTIFCIYSTSSNHETHACMISAKISNQFTQLDSEIKMFNFELQVIYSHMPLNATEDVNSLIECTKHTEQRNFF